MTVTTLRRCRSCSRLTARFRCVLCEQRFQAWLDGGSDFVPEWDGVISHPYDADRPRSAYDLALVQKVSQE